MPKDPHVPPFRITPVVLHVLLALAGGDRHGYRIMREVRQRTGGRVEIGPGSLYYTLDRLLGAGMIRETEGPDAPDVGDERRRYYALTDYGRRVLGSELSLLDDILALAREKGVHPDASPAAS